jgi:hypothetical protein
VEVGCQEVLGERSRARWRVVAGGEDVEKAEQLEAGVQAVGRRQPGQRQTKLAPWLGHGVLNTVSAGLGHGLLMRQSHSAVVLK